MRRQPVAFALIDAAFLADTKFRKLRRRLSEPRDFNSAVGAWLIVLTAARRNGLPGVDAAEEAEDPTFLGDLVAVGLLTETGIPDKPFRAWAPARPKYPSDLADRAHLAPSAPKATDAPLTPLARASTPLPSLPFNSLEDGASRAPAREAPQRDPEKGGRPPSSPGIEATRREAERLRSIKPADGSLAERLAADLDMEKLGWRVAPDAADA